MTVELRDITADAYHADPWDEPSLNATVATALALETPAHAKQKHPRLADQPIDFHSDAMDVGTALHQILLGDDRVDIFDFDAFRSNDAKAARDASRAAGRVPMVRSKWDEIVPLGESLKAQLAVFPIDPPLFVEGMAEQTILWEDDGVRFRARLDWLRSDLSAIDDLKKSRTAEPGAWGRSMFGLGYDIKAAFYVRAVEAAFGRSQMPAPPVFRWVAIEPKPPYAMSVHVLSPAALAAANAKLDLAILLWKECLESGSWPAYPAVVNTVDLMPWMVPQEEWDDAALDSVPF